MTKLLISSGSATAAERAVPAFSEDRLLLEEANHRMLNELAAATAALRLICSAGSARNRWGLLVEAIDRLEGVAEAQRIVSGPTRTSVNVAREAEALCRALVSSRPGLTIREVRLDLPDLWIDGATARRILLIEAELVSNALRHAFGGGAGELEVRISVEGTDAILAVCDDGPGVTAASAASGSGSGMPIVRELVGRAGGSIACESGPDGTAWRAKVPLDLDAMTRVRSGA